MKTQILSFFAALLGLSAFAQTTTNTDNVTLNVNLNPIQTLIVNPAQKIVDLNYVTKDDYADGVTSEQPNHLTVYSTGGFEVKIKSDTPTLEGTGGNTKNIATNTIKITAKDGTTPLTNPTYKTVNLSNTDKLLVSATTGGVDRNISIDYAGKGAEAYLNKYVAGQTPTIYTTTVTYTITAK